MSIPHVSRRTSDDDTSSCKCSDRHEPTSYTTRSDWNDPIYCDSDTESGFPSPAQAWLSVDPRYVEQQPLLHQPHLGRRRRHRKDTVPIHRRCCVVASMLAGVALLFCAGGAVMGARNAAPIEYGGGQLQQRGLRGHIFSSAVTNANSVVPPEDTTHTDNDRSLELDPDDGYVDDHTFLSVTTPLRAALAAVLILIVLIQLYLLASIYAHRKKPALQLAQPSVLAIFVTSGMVAVGSTYLLIPPSDPGCAARDPLLFTSLTLSGSVLAGRVWRITSLMSPVLTRLGGDASLAQVSGANSASTDTATHETDQTPRWERWTRTLKGWIMTVLTALSDYKSLYRNNYFAAEGYEAARRRRRDSVRRRVPVTRLLWLVFVLMLPQLLLQVFNLAVPSMRKARTVHVEESIGVAYYECGRSAGDWPVWLGFGLTVIPYALTLILSLSSEGLPEVFDELNLILSSLKVFGLVVMVAGPPLAMVVTPNARVYLLTCIALGAVLPPIWFLVWKKLLPLWKGDKVVIVSSLLRRVGTSNRRLNLGHDDASQADDSTHMVDAVTRKRQEETQHKSARIALSVGQMYVDHGELRKSIELYEEALALWKFDHNRRYKQTLGGFTYAEANSLSQKDVVTIMKLLMAKGRVAGMACSDNGYEQAARAWMDALDLFERAPEAKKIRDRTVVFPCFSAIFSFLKGGKIKQDRDGRFETDLVRRFVRETKLHGDPIHYGRALAMKAEVMARLGYFDEAHDAFETMKDVYVLEEHSGKISEVYMTDRCAQAFSQSALWHMQNGKTQLALSTCEHVIEEMLPKLDPKNVNNTHLMLLPIIRILKWQGQAKRMRELYDKCVVQNFLRFFGKDGESPCKPAFKPLDLVLKICDDDERYPGMEVDVAWMLSEEGHTVPEMVDNVYMNLCWSFKSLVGEICMRLARRLNDDEKDKMTLIEIGLTSAREADRKMKDDEGNVKLPIPYGVHAPVLTELESMAARFGIEVATVVSKTSGGSQRNVFQGGRRRVSFAAQLPVKEVAAMRQSSMALSAVSGLSDIITASELDGFDADDEFDDDPGHPTESAKFAVEKPAAAAESSSRQSDDIVPAKNDEPHGKARKSSAKIEPYPATTSAAPGDCFRDQRVSSEEECPVSIKDPADSFVENKA